MGEGIKKGPTIVSGPPTEGGGVTLNPDEQRSERFAEQMTEDEREVVDHPPARLTLLEGGRARLHPVEEDEEKATEDKTPDGPLADATVAGENDIS